MSSDRSHGQATGTRALVIRPDWGLASRFRAALTGVGKVAHLEIRLSDAGTERVEDIGVQSTGFSKPDEQRLAPFLSATRSP